MDHNPLMAVPIYKKITEITVLLPKLIESEKTKRMKVGIQISKQPRINIQGQPFDAIESFTYKGRTHRREEMFDREEASRHNYSVKLIKSWSVDDSFSERTTYFIKAL